MFPNAKELLIVHTYLYVKMLIEMLENLQKKTFVLINKSIFLHRMECKIDDIDSNLKQLFP